MTTERRDLRNQDPTGNHKRVFMGGWTDAVNGKRYATIDNRKTHANMGNLFGWIFGKQSSKFKEVVWALYVSYAINIEQD